MKSTRPAMSPLLRALTYSRAAHEPMVDGMLIQCYAALDAFQRGHAPDYADDITRAHEALVALDTRHAEDGRWTLADAEYPPLCDAFPILAAQLDAASLEHIAQAEARMVTQSLVATSMQPTAEAAELAAAEH